MRSYRVLTMSLVICLASMCMTTRSEAGGFSFSIFFPVPCPPPPPACPPPAPVPSKVWVPGHYEVHEERVRVPGECKTIWVPPAYRTVWDGCRYIRIVCSPGRYETISLPGHYDCHEVQAWVPGHYELARRDDDP